MKKDRCVEEMNLAEFPVALLTNGAAKGLKTLTFEGERGTLIVTGSDLYGLPTAPDVDVLVALLALTKRENDFREPTVPFSRYELRKILGWPDQGHTYRRIDEAMKRWASVTLFYKGSFYDNSMKANVDATFHIIDDILVYGDEVRKVMRATGQKMPPSTFTWHRIFFASCRNNYLKTLDLDEYFALGSSVTKRIYRFMDKRFHGDHPVWVFDLRAFAFGHVGLSKNYSDTKIKEQLKPALAELEDIGFLRKMSSEERYTKVARTGWRIRLARGRRVHVEGIEGDDGTEFRRVRREDATDRAARGAGRSEADGRP